MYHAFRNPFSIELGQLLDKVDIVQNDRSVRADRPRMFIRCYGNAGGRGREVFIVHDGSFQIYHGSAHQGEIEPTQPAFCLSVSARQTHSNGPLVAQGAAVDPDDLRDRSQPYAAW
jgi:hypothetical protein